MAVGLAGVLLAWQHYPPHQRALEGLFSYRWPRSSASTTWASVRLLSRLSVGAGALIAFGYSRPSLPGKGFFLWLGVVGALVVVALVSPVGAWPLFLWMIVSGLWSAGSWVGFGGE